MKVIEPSYEILTPITGNELEMIEKAARTCYKSESKISPESAAKLVANLIKNDHTAMLEHAPSLTIKFICDRGVSHEIVRHRMASFAQESTRYCNYTQDKFGNEITFIKPFFFDDEETYSCWEKAMAYVEKQYFELIKAGATAQEARTVLPNSVKTEIVMTANYREWRHFFKLRAARATGPAHPQMEELTIPLLNELKVKIPVIFDDIYPMGVEEA